MRLSLGYPSRSAEKCLLLQESRQDFIAQIQPVFNAFEIIELQQVVKQIYLSEAVLEYLLDLAEQTRTQKHGLSTRGVLAMKRAAQAYAFIEKCSYVITDDIQRVFIAVTAHRINISEQDAFKQLEMVNVL